MKPEEMKEELPEELNAAYVEETDEEWQVNCDKFFEEHPDCPIVEPVECLNLIMKREFAEKILTGEKKVEFRDCSEHYCKRLISQEMLDYIDKKLDDKNDPDFALAVDNYISSLRPVETIHFHNYNNTWFLDVRVKVNEIISITDEDVKFLQDEFNCHECDEDLEYYNKHPRMERPSYFYFVIDEVLDTNLE